MMITINNNAKQLPENDNIRMESQEEAFNHITVYYKRMEMYFSFVSKTENAEL